MFQLLQLSPPSKLRRHPDPLCGIPTLWHIADDSALRDGLAWVPVLDTPEYDPATQKLVPLPITVGIGYSVVDLTEEEIEARIPAPPKTITVGGITLLAEPKDRDLFTQLLVMLREAESFGALPDTVAISDATGTVHDLPTSTVRQILVSYGAALQSEWTAQARQNQAT